VLDEQSALKAGFRLLRDNAFERAAFARRITVDLFNVLAWIATAEDVILHKFYWNQITPSLRQLQHAAGVYAIQVDSLDIPYLQRWAESIGVQQELESLLSGKLKPKST
jgi:hypothetical protein